MIRVFSQILLGAILVLPGCRANQNQAISPPDEVVAPSGPILVVAALAYELAPIVEVMDSPSRTRVFGVRCYEGSLAGRPVIAAEVGVGKVNAAASAAVLIDRFRPSRVFMTGTAGALSPNLEVYDVVVAAETVQNDLGTQYAEWFEPWGTKNPTDGVRMPVYFQADRTLLQTAESIADARADVRIGTIASGDHFMSSAPHRVSMHQRFRADVVDMESAAVAQVCYRRRISFMAIRSVSDQTGESAVSAYRAHQREAARKAASVLLGIIEELPGGENSQ